MQRGIRGYYHVEHIRTAEDLAQLRETALQDGVSCLKIGLPDHDYEWIETNAKIDRAVKDMQRVREGLGDSIDIAVDFHAKMGPAVASIMIKEVEPLHLLFVEEPCPPENPAGHGPYRAPFDHAHRDRRASRRGLRLPGADRDGSGRHSANGH